MAKKINYTEADLMGLLNLKRVVESTTPEMDRWLNAPAIELDAFERRVFDRILPMAIKYIDGWNEEALKMSFISQILPLGNLLPNGRYNTFFEKTLSGVVDGIPLTTKTDFMVASGILDQPMKPFFHFQATSYASLVEEYKPSKPTGDSMAQLLEAMLIAQELNKNDKPLYGLEIVGKYWTFVTLKDKTYCRSKPFIATQPDDLLMIIRILRHFILILETEILS